jgi:hypothetical protein
MTAPAGARPQPKASSGIALRPSGREPEQSIPPRVELGELGEPLGSFPRAAWIRLIGEAGFDVRAVPLVHDERPVGAEGFLATRPR